MPREIDFYVEFSEKFKKNLLGHLGAGFMIEYSVNQSFDRIIIDLERLSGLRLAEDAEYVPKLKLDIVFLIYGKGKVPKLLLIEAKYLKQLSLINYSQLVGYLQVAKCMSLGLLVLIQKEYTSSKLSDDFQEIANLRKLPMDWIAELKGFGKRYSFRTGIVTYIPKGTIEWIDSHPSFGLSSYRELSEAIKEGQKGEGASGSPNR